MHALPIAKGEVDRIGKRLIAGEASVEDLRAWNQCLIAYDRVRADVVGVIETVSWAEVLAGHGSDLNVTSRVKTRGTLVDKLRRQPGSPLSRIQDVAGVRIDGSMTLDGQDIVSEQLVQRLGGRVIDRREMPIRGYRAVHVIVKVDGLACEIQIRTSLQHAWANLYERVADRLGRSIRYADESLAGSADDPVERVAPGSVEAGLIASLTRQSERIAELEGIGNDWASARVDPATGLRIVSDETGSSAAAEAEDLLKILKSVTKRVEEI
ncbi:hypothetical protein [Jannaschia sp. R86511]|uniref:hypothetical protein n=1 Tax=Jannaschia sp. R86511 TaxID=3093853 RepID=UPI0036D404FA